GRRSGSFLPTWLVAASSRRPPSFVPSVFFLIRNRSDSSPTLPAGFVARFSFFCNFIQMASGFGESSSGRDPQNSSFGESSSNNDAGSFECNICFELAQDPVVTLCGHLFCWPCLYKWLHGHAQSSECPVCKAIVEEEKLVPLYGRGKNSTDPRSKSMPGMNIPHRPAGQRPATAPPPDPNNFHHANPWFMGGAPVASTRFGNFTFSAAIGGLFPLLSFQVHGIPDATAYGPGAGFPYGYGNAFHGGHVHGFPRHVQHGQQADVYLKALLILVGALVIASLVWF
ncbi:Ternary complex factor MIP1, partial [Musa troglodytarum]